MVERYWPGVTVDKLREDLAEAQLQQHYANRGSDVRYLGSILLPTDEVVFYVFEAPSIEAVERASRQARLPAERVLESIWIGSSDQPQAEAIELDLTTPVKATDEGTDQ